MNQAMTATEQRNSFRESEELDHVKVEIKKIVYPMKKEEIEIGGLRDIGEGGIGFNVPIAYEPGSILEVKIHLAGWQRFKKSYSRLIDDDVAVAPLTAVGEVVWCELRSDGPGFAVGVVFKDVYEDDYQAMQKFLAKIRLT